LLFLNFDSFQSVIQTSILTWHLPCSDQGEHWKVFYRKLVDMGRGILVF